MTPPDFDPEPGLRRARQREVASGGAIQFFALAARSATCAKTPLSCLPSSWNQTQRSVPSLCTASTVILKSRHSPVSASALSSTRATGEKWLPLKTRSDPSPPLLTKIQSTAETWQRLGVLSGRQHGEESCDLSGQQPRDYYCQTLPQIGAALRDLWLSDRSVPSLHRAESSFAK